MGIYVPPHKVVLLLHRIRELLMDNNDVTVTSRNVPTVEVENDPFQHAFAEKKHIVIHDVLVSGVHFNIVYIHSCWRSLFAVARNVALCVYRPQRVGQSGSRKVTCDTADITSTDVVLDEAAAHAIVDSGYLSFAHNPADERALCCAGNIHKPVICAVHHIASDILAHASAANATDISLRRISCVRNCAKVNAI